MKSIKNIGICALCQQKIEHRFMTQHIKNCCPKFHDTYQNSGKEKIFLIKISCDKLFWLYIEINGSDDLEDLDSVLRNVWLECCNHMSQFKINNTYYNYGKMNKTIHRSLPVNTSFIYEYDMGCTTRLEGKVLSAVSGQLKNSPRVVARNSLPEDILCTACKKSPEVICSICFDFCCKKCRGDHACQEDEMMLPVVNSPRMGVCGYTGPITW